MVVVAAITRDLLLCWWGCGRSCQEIDLFWGQAINNTVGVLCLGFSCSVDGIPKSIRSPVQGTDDNTTSTTTTTTTAAMLLMVMMMTLRKVWTGVARKEGRKRVLG